MSAVKIILAIISLIPAFCFAQKLEIRNLPKYDLQRIHFGFTLALNRTNFIMQFNAGSGHFDSVYAVEPVGQSGFNLGIVSNLRLSSFFDLRFIPALSFAQRNLEYTIKKSNGSTVVEKKIVESTFLEFPVLVKFKSVRIRNGRVYVLGGAKYSLDLASQANVEDKEEIIVKLTKHDFGYEIGFGLDFYLQYFKFSPEIKLCFGFNNMLYRENTVYTDVLSQLRTQVLLISFMFE